MKRAATSLRGALACVFVALLASCGGVQSTLAFPGAGTLPASLAKGLDLLYIGDAASGGVLVYTFLPALKFREILTVPAVPGGECVDQAQTIFITDMAAGSHVVYEYVHGGSAPFAILGDPNGTPSSCAVDPTSGNLAVTSLHTAGGNGELAIYKAAKGAPKMYSGFFRDMLFCGYDASGNLYVDGVDASSHFLLAQLPKRGASLRRITLNRNIIFPGGVQWDGRHLAVGDDRGSLIYRFAISGSAGTEVGETRLAESPNLYQFYIRNGLLIDPTYSPSHVLVGFYRYPAGGRPARVISGVSTPYSAVLSLGAK